MKNPSNDRFRPPRNMKGLVILGGSGLIESMGVPESQPGHRKVALFANAHSRKARTDPSYLSGLERDFGDRGPFILSRSVGELPEAAADIFRADPDLIFISGGDGTLRQTLTHLSAVYGEKPLPRVAILRGGTMNTVSTSLHIHRAPLEQLRRILRAHDEGIPLLTVRRPMLRVNRHSGFIFGLGGFSRFIEHYQAAEDPTPGFAFRLLTKTVVSLLAHGHFAASFFQKFPVNVWRDQQPWMQGTEVTNISASTIRHIGFNFKPYFGAEESEDSLGLLVFRGLPTRLILHLPKLYRGRPVDDEALEQVPAREVLIKTDQPMRPMLDGDILKAEQTFDIRTGPVLELVVG